MVLVFATQPSKIGKITKIEINFKTREYRKDFASSLGRDVLVARIKDIRALERLVELEGFKEVFRWSE